MLIGCIKCVIQIRFDVLWGKLEQKNHLVLFVAMHLLKNFSANFGKNSFLCVSVKLMLIEFRHLLGSLCIKSYIVVWTILYSLLVEVALSESDWDQFYGAIMMMMMMFLHYHFASVM